jgi:hypothetical protein
MLIEMISIGTAPPLQKVRQNQTAKRCSIHILSFPIKSLNMIWLPRNGCSGRESMCHFSVDKPFERRLVPFKSSTGDWGSQAETAGQYSDGKVKLEGRCVRES